MSRRRARQISANMDRVRDKIEQAFSDVPYPGDGNIADGIGMEDIQPAFAGTHWKQWCPGRRKGQHWRGKDWGDHFPRLPGYYDAPFLMTEDAFIFYLPAFLIFSLDYYDADRVASVTIHALSPHFYRSDVDGLMRRVMKLTPPQRKAIRLFFEHLYMEWSGDPDIDKSLAFWSALANDPREYVTSLEGIR